MPGRVGGKLDRGFGLEPVTRSMRRTAPGLYRQQNIGRAEPGGIRVPTILEAYNRDSDFKRWQEGQQYFYGTGRSWADFQIRARSRLLIDTGAGPFSYHITTLFPGSTSPEGNWAVTTLVRGSAILSQPIQAAEITVVPGDPDNPNNPDSLVLDVSSSLTVDQVANWAIYVGAQFEDSAAGTTYPDDLISEPATSLALTLIEVRPSSQQLIFDLTRPYTRVRISEQVYWKRVEYNAANPVYWRSNGTRYLCNSFRFHCSCPDHSGRAYADTLSLNASRSQRNTAPTAGRSPATSWEANNRGLYRQFRDLSRRFDQRRECKHIHAMRWACGVPFYEPSDYPLGGESMVFSRNRSSLSEASIWKYHSTRTIELDRLTFSAAEVVGLDMNPRGDLLNPEVPFRVDSRPVLWNLANEPDSVLCRGGDWYLKRGSQELSIFNDNLQRFVLTAPLDSVTTTPVFEVFAAGDSSAPVVIP